MSLTSDKIKEYLHLDALKGQPKATSSKAKKNMKSRSVALKNAPVTKGKKRKKNNIAILTSRPVALKILFFSIIFFGIVIVIGLIGFGVMVYADSKNLPPPGKPFAKNISQNTNIYDRNGVLLASLHGDVNREWVDLSNISPNMKTAMLAAEDVNFYNEPGFDVTSIIRAALTDVLHHGSELQGASTITQELVKNVDLTNNGVAPRTIQVKIEELILTLEVERQYTKDQILQAYLNEISFGGDGSGIKVASQEYFNIEPSQLDLAQSAYLAGLVQAPSYYSPLFSDNPDALQDSIYRADYVLDNMLDHSSITHVTAAQIAAAKKELNTFTFTSQVNSSGYKAPHFVQYVQNALETKLGFTSDEVNNGGLEVYTTLNYNMQQIAQAEIDKMFSDFKNTKLPYQFDGDDAAEASIDPKTGEILTMVGSPTNITDINILTSSPDANGLGGVQPGSSIKPFLYMSAFKNLGMSPTTFMPDIPYTIPAAAGAPAYSPTDFEGDQPNPTANINYDLTNSLNRPAVETLYSLGQKDFLSDLTADGEVLDDSNYGLAYAIGAENVNLLDHINAYGILANEGTLYPATGILKVTDANGKVLYQYNPQAAGKKIIDSAYPYLVDTMLEHYGYLVKWGGYLATKDGYDIAGKTGTNNTVVNGQEANGSSMTFVGYTPDLVSGFWYGNEANQGKPLNQVNTYYPPTGEFTIPYWADYMQKVLPMFAKDKFQRPSDVVEAQVCPDSGLLYQSGKSLCTPTTAEFQQTHLPPVDNEHTQAAVCSSNQNMLASPAIIAAGQSVTKVIATLKTFDPFFQPFLDSFDKNSDQVPTQYCDSSQGLSIGIVSPTSGQSVTAGSQVNINAIVAEVNSTNTVSSVSATFNSNSVGNLTAGSQNSYTGSFTVPANTPAGTYTVGVEAVDSANSTQTATVSITVGAAAAAPPTNSNISITSPATPVVVGGVSTPLKFSVLNTPASTVTSGLFNILSGGQTVGTVNATQNTASSGEWDAAYTFPTTPNTGYEIQACATISGTQSCNSIVVTAQ